MRVAVTIFGSTISPVFDVARQLLVVDIEDGAPHVRCEEAIGQLDLARRVALLSRLGVRVLACGAISERSHNALLERGIEVYPWVSGEVQEVLGILARRSGACTAGVGAPTRLAIPATGPGFDALVAPSFRRCSHLLFVETRDMSRTVTRVAGGLDGGAGCYLLARMIVERDAQILLTGRCGPNALGILAVAGVKVIQGVEGRAMDAAGAYSGGSQRRRRRHGRGPG